MNRLIAPYNPYKQHLHDIPASLHTMVFFLPPCSLPLSLSPRLYILPYPVSTPFKSCTYSLKTSPPSPRPRPNPLLHSIYLIPLQNLLQAFSSTHSGSKYVLPILRALHPSLTPSSCPQLPSPLLTLVL